MIDLTQIIITAITIGVPATVTLLTSNKLRRQANKHNSRDNIMQLILEDHVRVMEGDLPENRQIIHEQFDEYRASGGNSYICQKVEEYENWYKTLSKRKEKDMVKAAKTKKPRKNCK